jgi:hypothetical protein
LRCELELAQPFGLIKEIRSGNPCSSAGLVAQGVTRLTRPALQDKQYPFEDIQGVPAHAGGVVERQPLFQ